MTGTLDLKKNTALVGRCIIRAQRILNSALEQISTGGERRPSPAHRPQLSDLRGRPGETTPCGTEEHPVCTVSPQCAASLRSPCVCSRAESALVWLCGQVRFWLAGWKRAVPSPPCLCQELGNGSCSVTAWLTGLRAGGASERTGFRLALTQWPPIHLPACCQHHADAACPTCPGWEEWAQGCFGLGPFPGALIPALCLCCRRSPHPDLCPDAAQHRSARTRKFPLPLAPAVPCPYRPRCPSRGWPGKSKDLPRAEPHAQEVQGLSHPQGGWEESGEGLNEEITGLWGRQAELEGMEGGEKRKADRERGWERDSRTS